MPGKTKLPGFVAKIEDVPEEVRDFYIEDVDAENKPRFKLNSDEVQDVTGLKSTVSTLRRENATQKTRLKLIEGLDDDEAESIITAGREAIEAKKSGKPVPEVESVKAQMQKTYDKEIGKRDKEILGMQTAFGKILEKTAKAELKAVGAPEVLLLPHLLKSARMVKVENADGSIDYVERVFEEDGKTERLGNDGKPMGIAALVAEMGEHPDFKGVFPGTGVSGSGTLGDGSSGMPAPTREGTPRNNGTPPKQSVVDRKRASGDYRI